MSKSILQEVATLNAEEFNLARMFSELKDYEALALDNTTKQELLTDNLENQYKEQLINLYEETSNSNELLKAEMLQTIIDTNALQRFSLKQFASIFHLTGAMKKEYRRDKINLEWSIDKQQFQKLSYYTGPVQTEDIDPITGLHASYSTVLPETSWSWLYIDAVTNKHMKYASHNVISINNNIVQLGDATYATVLASGDLNVTKDLDVLGGWLHVQTPSASGIPESINVNGHIKSTIGALEVEEGLATTRGNITTGAGGVSCTTDIETVAGDIFTNLGNIYTVEGYVASKLGMTTSTVGFECTTSGNFITADGYSKVTTGYTSDTGGYVSLVSGSYTTPQGNFTTDDGYFYTLKGKIHSVEGDLLIDDGDGTIHGLLTVDEFLCTGESNFQDDVTFTDNTKLDIFDLNVRNSVKVGGVAGTFLRLDSSELKVLVDQTTVQKITAKEYSLFEKDVEIRGGLITTGDSRAANYYTNGKFYGVATSAEYADLAEIYLADDQYKPGTVLSMGGTKEVTLYDPSLPLAGIVSTNPGYLLNSSVQGVAIALKGRVPVATQCAVMKGDYIFPSDTNPGMVYGVSKRELSSHGTLDLIGVAIYDSVNNQVEVKI